MTELNWMDYIILAIFFFSIFLGLARGLVSEIISIITMVAAFIIATTFSNSFALTIMDYGAVQNLTAKTSTAFGGNTADAISYVALAISFMILFAGTLLVGALVKFFLNLAFHTGILGIGNRLLGGMFGVARGFILSLVVIFLIQLTPLNGEQWWQQSYLVTVFQPAVAWLDSKVTPAMASLREKLENSNINLKFQEFINKPKQ